MQVIPAGRLQLAVLASGRGSNFDALCQAIERGDLDADIKVLVSDKENAPALEKARKRNIEAVYLSPRSYNNRDEYETELVNLLKETVQ